MRGGLGLTLINETKRVPQLGGSLLPAGPGGWDAGKLAFWCGGAITQQQLEKASTYMSQNAQTCASIVPRQSKEERTRHNEVSGDAGLPYIRTLLDSISPKSYRTWLTIGRAIHYESGGSVAGLELFKEWTAGGETPWTPSSVESRWKSFPTSFGTPTQLDYIESLARKSSAEVESVPKQADPIEMECVNPVESVGSAATATENLFERASLRDHHRELKQEVQEQRTFLGGLALLGQSTVFFADPNIGKTVTCISSLMKSVQAGDINPEDAFYLNVDDSGAGLADKVAMLKEYGVHMLGDGYHGFSVDLFKPWTTAMIADGSIKGKIFILDTLTRFVDTNNKTKARQFTKHVRTLTSKGATVIALAHTRKNPGQDGGKVYAGTSDVYNDFDCAYMVVQLSAGGADGLKTIEFQNFKRRGDVKLKAAYTYPNRPMKSYEDLVLSVELADPDAVSTLTRAAEVKSDAEVISAIRLCIQQGVKTRMLIANTVGPKLHFSRAKTLGVLDKYTGEIPGMHFWSFKVAERGAHVYAVVPVGQASESDSQLSSFPVPGRTIERAPDFHSEENEIFEEVAS